mmetsp:Transcript_11523/g.20404  ORF Transcript_11523/g.20404 Transcript_11523/m.20404 type:complete len:105 (+) Transcript_11523:779-1093(+)
MQTLLNKQCFTAHIKCGTVFSQDSQDLLVRGQSLWSSPSRVLSININDLALVVEKSCHCLHTVGLTAQVERSQRAQRANVGISMVLKKQSNAPRTASITGKVQW